MHPNGVEPIRPLGGPRWHLEADQGRSQLTTGPEDFCRVLWGCRKAAFDRRTWIEKLHVGTAVVIPVASLEKWLKEDRG
jgi:hypothetical protein